MPIASLHELTWHQARETLADEGTVAILPVGAIEAHGPHLPLSTDVVIAEAMARAGAERLSARGRSVLLLPTLAYTAAGFAAGFPGTVTLAPETVTATLVDLARSLGRHGLRVFAVANAHLDPAHLASIERAAEMLAEDGTPRFAFPNLTRKPWAVQLTDEFRSGACHAGRFETSVVMADRPELVRDAIRAELPANPVSLSEAIRRGQRTFEEAGGGEAYFGYPAQASAAEGAETIEVLGSILEEAVLDARG
jgi:creatinine amidohydrolase